MDRKILEADLVIAFSRRNGIQVIKNRDGHNDEKLDLADVLELILPFQEKYLHSSISIWIDKLKTYRVFS
jgi:hypothetical protein